MVCFLETSVCYWSVVFFGLHHLWYFVGITSLSTGHHLAEFLEVDFSVVVLVDMPVDCLDVLVGEGVSHSLEGSSELGSGDVTISIDVQLLEHSLQRQREWICFGNDEELLEIDVSIMILVGSLEHGIQLVFRWRLSHFLHHSTEFFSLDESISIEIELSEDSLQIVLSDLSNIILILLL